MCWQVCDAEGYPLATCIGELADCVGKENIVFDACEYGLPSGVDDPKMCLCNVDIAATFAKVGRTATRDFDAFGLAFPGDWIVKDGGGADA